MACIVPITWYAGRMSNMQKARSLANSLGYGPRASARVGIPRRMILVRETASQKVARILRECEAVYLTIPPK